LGIARGFVLKNLVPETLAGHGLRVTVGVFGVLFELLGNFLEMTIEVKRASRGTSKKISSDRKKP
jgi:hypothetical protein